MGKRTMVLATSLCTSPSLPVAARKTWSREQRCHSMKVGMTEQGRLVQKTCQLKVVVEGAVASHGPHIKSSAFEAFGRMKTAMCKYSQAVQTIAQVGEWALDVSHH